MGFEFCPARINTIKTRPSIPEIPDKKFQQEIPDTLLVQGKKFQTHYLYRVPWRFGRAGQKLQTQVSWTICELQFRFDRAFNLKQSIPDTLLVQGALEVW
jgi:hypothetical protein